LPKQQGSNFWTTGNAAYAQHFAQAMKTFYVICVNNYQKKGTEKLHLKKKTRLQKLQET